ncbi:LiaF transmembrane domain-containing protein [Halomicrococcus gelatinilyticus]|uniref:LiaF transmembrane domain-containing protein n=1 Tax=Halomicrococcus gelatinilyticus TaxID=1702103 RepID=UPI002E139B64
MSLERRPNSQALFGALIILLGIVLLLNTTGVYDTSFLVDFVPSLFVLVGLYALVTSRFRNVTGPLVLVTVALAWQLVALDVVVAADLGQFWPVLLIIFGVSVVLGRLRSQSVAVGSEYVSTLAIFGGRNQRATSRQFNGGDLTALFGGVELDLRKSEVTDRPAQINVVALFGGVEVVVPREWNVQMDVLPVFGGAEDERPHRSEEHDEVDLVVTGFTAFGGVSVSD